MTNVAAMPLPRAALLATIVLCTGSASAGVPSITYTAAEGCPSEAEFAAEVAAHLKANATDLKLTLSVDVGQNNGAAFARVSYVDADGKTVVRELSAATCDEVASAAALVTSLAIEVLARDSSPPADAPPPATPPAPSAPKQDAMMDEPPPQRSESAGSVASSHWEIGAGAFADNGLAPEPMLGGSAFVGLNSFPAWSVRLHFEASTNLLAQSGDRSAEFQLFGGRLDACALPLVTTTRFTVQPCAAAVFGSVRSNGIETDRYYANSERQAWGAGGPLIRAQGKFVELFVDAELGPWFPIVGTRKYVFQGTNGEVSFHEVPIVGWFFAAHAALAL
jgi:hypothetical protein